MGHMAGALPEVVSPSHRGAPGTLTEVALQGQGLPLRPEHALRSGEADAQGTAQQERQSRILPHSWCPQPHVSGASGLSET